MFESIEETPSLYPAIKTIRYETTLKPIKDRVLTIHFDLVSGDSFSYDSLDEPTKDPFGVDPVKQNIKKCFLLRKSSKSSDSSATETSGTSQLQKGEKTALNISTATMLIPKSGDALATKSSVESELEMDEPIEEDALLSMTKSSLDRIAPEKTKKARKRPAKEKSLVCNVCEKAFVYKIRYEKHLLTHREAKAEEIFKCDFCGKGFRKKYYVTSHFKKVHLHRASKIYKCEGCPKFFRSRSGFMDHKKAHHGPNDECLSCPTCGKIFTMKKSLIHHLKTFPNHSDVPSGSI